MKELRVLLVAGGGGRMVASSSGSWIHSISSALFNEPSGRRAGADDSNIVAVGSANVEPIPQVNTYILN
jgi:hypothetical protein